MDAVLMSSKSGDWKTPEVIVNAVTQCYGGSIDLDPCSGEGSIVNATENWQIIDGLDNPWHGTVYCNPPYGREIWRWVQKAVVEYECGNASEVILLVPARTDTHWWSMLAAYPWCGIRGRLTFVGAENPAPFPSAVYHLGRRHGTFYDVFSELGTIWRAVL